MDDRHDDLEDWHSRGATAISTTARARLIPVGQAGRVGRQQVPGRR